MPATALTSIVLWTAGYKGRDNGVQCLGLTSVAVANTPSLSLELIGLIYCIRTRLKLIFELLARLTKFPTYVSTHYALHQVSWAHGIAGSVFARGRDGVQRR